MVVSAWAVMMHQIKGLSLSRAVIDLSPDIFAHAQSYVALSRVRSIPHLACSWLAGVMLVGSTNVLPQAPKSSP